MFAGYEVLREEDDPDLDREAIYIFAGEVVLPASLADERHWPRPVSAPCIDLGEGVTRRDVENMLAHMVDSGGTEDCEDDGDAAITEAERRCESSLSDGRMYERGETMHGRY